MLLKGYPPIGTLYSVVRNTEYCSLALVPDSKIAHERIGTMRVSKINADIFRPLGSPIHNIHSPLRFQIADHFQTTCSRKNRNRSNFSCQARFSDSEELRKQKKALEALLKTSKEAEGNHAILNPALSAWILCRRL